MDVNDAERIHQPSPIQEAILWGSSEPHLACGQLTCLLAGPLDAGAMEKAADEVAARHPILRTFFLSRRLDRPLQIVHRQPKLPVEWYDWSNLSAVQQQEKLQNYSRRDRERGFDLAKPPLLRVSLCRTENGAHRLVVTYHRAVLDKPGARRFLNELLRAHASGGREELPQGVPYGDYLAWLKSWNASAADAFWRETLEDVGSPTPLAMERFSATMQDESAAYGEEIRQLLPGLVTRIRRVASASGVRAATLLHAAWGLLLSRYSGEIDIVFGTSIDTCPPLLREAGVVLGPLTNSLPFRLRVQPRITVDRWLAEIETQQQRIGEHAHSSLVAIHRLSNPPFATPLFESCVAAASAALSNAVNERYGPVTVREIQEGPPEFPLTVEGDLDCGVVRLRYERRRFAPDVIAGVLEHMEILFDGLTAEPTRPVSEVPLLSEATRRQLLIDWNDTDTHYPANRCIHWLFETQATKTPDTPAVSFEGECLTYRKLNEQANQLAHYLQRLGVGPEVLVAICMERSIDMIVAILGVLKSGGAWVPLDPAYPVDRLAFMLEDAQPPVLLTQDRVLDRLPSCWGQVMSVDGIRGEIDQESAGNPTSAVGGDNLAYVMYTSGSTGKPKGAMVHHRGICNTSEQMIEVFDQKPGTRLLQFASMSFDMSVLDILPALISGETLCLARQDSMLGHDLGQLLKEQRIQALTIPPSVLATVPEIELPELEIIRVAGEPVSADLVTRWLPGRRLYNAYGPAEGSIWVSGAYLDTTRSPHIGRPIANIQIYVLDASFQPVPVGVQGELCFAGVGVGRGYLNRPSLTAEKFVPNPFATELGERLYRTGDLARYLPDGNLEFLGRVDEQVKLHGFRIELGEIEASLIEHPSVSQAAVLLREDGPDAKRLVAYVVPHVGRQLTGGELRTHLRTKLPVPMIPSAFVLLDSMPLTVNGKLDRRALPAPEYDRAITESAFVAPRNPMEETVAKIFGEVLGMERVGITDNFFDLGGHSLLATQLLSRIRVAFSIDLPLAEVFRGPTVAQLSDLIDSAADQEAAMHPPPIISVPRRNQQGSQADPR
jgi:amino acid adenylation domain-containing protein